MTREYASIIRPSRRPADTAELDWDSIRPRHREHQASRNAPHPVRKGGPSTLCAWLPTMDHRHRVRRPRLLACLGMDRHTAGPLLRARLLGSHSHTRFLVAAWTVHA